MGDFTLMPFNGLVASAEILDGDNTQNLVINPLEWQREGWAFYHTTGELRFAIGTWLSNCLSRVRIIAAVKNVGEDNPTPVTDGPYADIVASLAGGIGGQAAMLKRMAVQLSVPGDSYLVGEDPSGLGILRLMDWKVYSSSEIRITSRATRSNMFAPGTNARSRTQVTYEVNTMRNEWRKLAPESMVVRCWQPDDQFSWLATSVVESALPTLREIDMYNRQLVAIINSRLAMNGMLLMPEEVTLPSKPQYKDRDDPFMAELIDIAAAGIKSPGSPRAAIPMMLKIPSEFIDKVRHLIFATPEADDIVAKRDRALSRLAVSLNVPTEVITGMHQMNHWGQWQLEESGVKTYISPLAEIIVNCFTQGFFYPLIDAAGLSRTDENGGQYLIWYDPSELTQQPDRSGEALNLYDRGELSGDALRREAGFEEADMPSDDDFKDMALRKIAMSGGANAMQALAALTGDESLLPPAPAPAPDQSNGEDTQPDEGGDQPPAEQTPQSENTPSPPNTRPQVALLLLSDQEAAALETVG